MEKQCHVLMSIAVSRRKTRKQVLHEERETLWIYLNALDDNVAALKQEILYEYEDDV